MFEKREMKSLLKKAREVGRNEGRRGAPRGRRWEEDTSLDGTDSRLPSDFTGTETYRSEALEVSNRKKSSFVSGDRE